MHSETNLYQKIYTQNIASFNRKHSGFSILTSILLVCELKFEPCIHHNYILLHLNSFQSNFFWSNLNSIFVHHLVTISLIYLVTSLINLVTISPYIFSNNKPYAYIILLCFPLRIRCPLSSLVLGLMPFNCRLADEVNQLCMFLAQLSIQAEKNTIQNTVRSK